MKKPFNSNGMKKPNDSFGQSDIPLLWLLLHGKLPISVFTEQRFIYLLPLVETVIYLQEKGESPPYLASKVWQIASQRFNASDALKDKLKETHNYEADSSIVEAIRQRLLFEKVLDLVSTQLETGKYNTTQIVKLLEENKEINTKPVSRLQRPQREKEKYFIQTCIGPIDKVLGGIKDELVIVSAPPKQGKTNLFINMTARQPLNTIVLYITVADYGFDEINQLVDVVNPGLFDEKENFYIADYTGTYTTLNEIDEAIKEVWVPDTPMVMVVDRAEKMKTLGGKNASDFEKFDEIFSGLRRLAKKYTVAVFTDSQYGAGGSERARETGEVSSMYMYGDHTIRQSIMDLYMGILRGDGETFITLEGRRQGRTPAQVRVRTNQLGVYL